MIPKGLAFIRELEWAEVFGLWGRDESRLPHWIAHYQKRGFSSWEEWRRSSVKDLQPERLRWCEYRLNDLNIVRSFHGGPFRSWKKKYYGDADTLPFNMLAKKTELQDDSHINEIIRSFPRESSLIGLKNGGNIVIIEGMHRCSAIAVAMERNVSIRAEMRIALAEYDGTIPPLGNANSPT